ncbi:hypothetical protein [Spirosoma endbachense]|uniref:Uncharacterized protein n=1 Tax=Spirosoma endbachense TaxID=2666025 RepID=A0A6P1W2P3_9BACT|nr:hypothetical protein [Spirosoma endbachense]QHV97956.1 hypothetical protein GJR95_24400 [Spirosoma endbachense]
MEKPEFFPSLAEYLSAYDIKPDILIMAIAGYLENVEDVMKIDYNHYEDPFAWILAEGYRQQIDAFYKLLSDDRSRMEDATQQGKGQLGTSSNEEDIRVGDSRGRGSRQTDLSSLGHFPAGTRRANPDDIPTRTGTKNTTKRRN